MTRLTEVSDLYELASLTTQADFSKEISEDSWVKWVKKEVRYIYD